jgi:Uma2 family endonuclease
MEVPSLLEHIGLDVWPGEPSEIKAVPLGRPATTEDLRRTKLKAEIVGARVGYVVDLPHRLAFCPDVSWYTGRPLEADFPRGAPAFAAEVRDVHDYGDEFERYFASTRADYFATGTKVLWDVDVLREGLVRVYRAADPGHPTIHRRGEIADAESAVPGWRMPVDELFR